MSIEKTVIEQLRLISNRQKAIEFIQQLHDSTKDLRERYGWALALLIVKHPYSIGQPDWDVMVKDVNRTHAATSAAVDGDCFKIVESLLGPEIAWILLKSYLIHYNEKISVCHQRRSQDYPVYFLNPVDFANLADRAGVSPEEREQFGIMHLRLQRERQEARAAGF